MLNATVIPPFKCFCKERESDYYCFCRSTSFFGNLKNKRFPEVSHKANKKNDDVNEVDVGFQPIEEIPEIITIFKNLKIFSAINSSLKSLNLHGHLNLEIVDLSFNEIKNINPTSFVVGMEIKQLDLSHNSLTVLKFRDFQRLHKLESLNISRNKITSIEDNDSAMLPKLLQLNLAFNSIKILPKWTIYPKNSLKELNLNYNRISESDEEFIVAAKITTNLNIHLLKNGCVDKVITLTPETENSQNILTELSKDCSQIHSQWDNKLDSFVIIKVHFSDCNQVT